MAEKGSIERAGFDIKYIEERYHVSTLCFPEVHASTLRPLLMEEVLSKGISLLCWHFSCCFSSLPNVEYVYTASMYLIGFDAYIIEKWEERKHSYCLVCRKVLNENNAMFEMSTRLGLFLEVIEPFSFFSPY